MLSKVKRFAQNYDCHVWFVAHPRVLRDWRGEPPNLYDISGSAHFINKADNGIVVHRMWPAKPTDEKQRGRREQRPPAGWQGPGEVPEGAVRILVRKVRNKAVGTVGEALLVYDRVTGRYSGVKEYLRQQGAGAEQQGGTGMGGGGNSSFAGVGGGGQGARGMATAAAIVQEDVSWQGEVLDPVTGEVREDVGEDGAGDRAVREPWRDQVPAGAEVVDHTKPKPAQEVNFESPLYERDG
jgi:hypothetical protein